MTPCPWQQVERRELSMYRQVYVVATWRCEKCGKLVEDWTHKMYPISPLKPESLPCGLTVKR